MNSSSDMFTHLRELILREGPISVAHFMEEALYNPTLGYYTGRDPIGARGDFTTAPEICQIFGELIGIWCVKVWQDIGAPENLQLVELGPGRGTLLVDALRATQNIQGFHSSINLNLVEISDILRAKQKVSLKAFCETVGEPAWFHDLSQVPDGPAVIIANEFFDALPVRHFQRKMTSWRERFVDLNENKDGLVFIIGDVPVGAQYIPASLYDAEEGAWVETSQTGIRIMHTLADRISKQGGAALIIDYGYTNTAPGKTLQAVQGHKFAEVLAAPGEQDLTAHVDFAALKHMAQNTRALVHGPVEQGAFLNALGLSTRVQSLSERTMDEDQLLSLFSGADRLVDRYQMGSLFKALGVSNREIITLPGF